jgi:hypothetical protein
MRRTTDACASLPGASLTRVFESVSGRLLRGPGRRCRRFSPGCGACQKVPGRMNPSRTTRAWLHWTCCAFSRLNSAASARFMDFISARADAERDTVEDRHVRWRRDGDVAIFDCGTAHWSVVERFARCRLPLGGCLWFSASARRVGATNGGRNQSSNGSPMPARFLMMVRACDFWLTATNRKQLATGNQQPRWRLSVVLGPPPGARGAKRKWQPTTARCRPLLADCPRLRRLASRRSAASNWRLATRDGGVRGRKDGW